jgi:hypothetical protein
MVRREREFPPETEEPAAETVAAVEPAPEQARVPRPGRVHLVVVRTREVRPDDRVPPGTMLLTIFWHPRDRRWMVNAFESLEHAVHLFVDESGWTLRQQQALDGPHTFELIFEARREDFSRPSTEALLEEVGLTPEEVAKMLQRVDREGPFDAAPPAG